MNGEIKEAIEWFQGGLDYRKEQEQETRKRYGGELPSWHENMNRMESLAIKALEAYQPCEWCEGETSKYFDVNWHDFNGDFYAVGQNKKGQKNYCPNCGRRLT